MGFILDRTPLYVLPSLFRCFGIKKFHTLKAHSHLDPVTILDVTDENKYNAPDILWTSVRIFPSPKTFLFLRFFMDYQPIDQLQPTNSANKHKNLVASPYKKESLIGSRGN